MKQITRKEFIEIKTPVLFNKIGWPIAYTYFPEWLKLENDFYYVEIIWDPEQEGKEIFESWQRDWFYEDSELFYIYDNKDIDNLIEILKELIQNRDY